MQESFPAPTSLDTTELTGDPLTDLLPRPNAVSRTSSELHLKPSQVLSEAMSSSRGAPGGAVLKSKSLQEDLKVMMRIFWFKPGKYPKIHPSTFYVVTQAKYADFFTFRRYALHLRRAWLAHYLPGPLCIHPEKDGSSTAPSDQSEEIFPDATRRKGQTGVVTTAAEHVLRETGIDDENIATLCLTIYLTLLPHICWRPFGRGKTVRTGRFVTEHIIKSCVAIILRRFDLGVLGGAQVPCGDECTPGLGIMGLRVGEDFKVKITARASDNQFEKNRLLTKVTSGGYEQDAPLAGATHYKHTAVSEKST
ncbi:hypothetical protein PG985_003633 [Apiospora marii]|uniref:Uncharacterized protein n=1 Tax=Apiospora marii TaxID=335849 RepID=A0ABR1SHI9_9PEZI